MRPGRERNLAHTPPAQGSPKRMGIDQSEKFLVEFNGVALAQGFTQAVEALIHPQITSISLLNVVFHLDNEVFADAARVFFAAVDGM